MYFDSPGLHHCGGPLSDAGEVEGEGGRTDRTTGGVCLPSFSGRPSGQTDGLFLRKASVCLARNPRFSGPPLLFLRSAATRQEPTPSRAGPCWSWRSTPTWPEAGGPSTWSGWPGRRGSKCVSSGRSSLAGLALSCNGSGCSLLLILPPFGNHPFSAQTVNCSSPTICGPSRLRRVDLVSQVASAEWSRFLKLISRSQR